MSLVRSRFQRDEDAVDDRQLMCRANGCQNRWSVQTAEVTACSYHAFSDAKEWPHITDDIFRGIAALPGRKESPTVRDMKTRVRGSLGNFPL